MSVSVSYVVPQAAGIPLLFFDVVCYVVRYIVFFLDIFFNMILPVVSHRAVAEGCCELRMAERNHCSLSFSFFLFLSLSLSPPGPKRQVFLNPGNMNGR